jgi:hypothetical protein
VSFIGKGKRTPWVAQRDWSPSRYLLVLAGYGHPEPPKAVEWNAWHDPDHLREFDRDISRYIAEQGVEVLVDYRDVRNMEEAIREDKRRQAEELMRMEARINGSAPSRPQQTAFP